MTCFSGRTALVTGAGRGIGRGCALALARAGANVVLVSRSSDQLEEVVAEAQATGAHATALPCDVTDHAAVDRALSSLDRIDILVQAAGTNIPEPFVDVSESHLDQLLALNVKAVFLVAQAAARMMVARRDGGAIVTISSQMGHVGAPNRSVYCASKHAVEGLTKALAVELAPHRIRVNSVAPTFVDTAMTAPFFEDRSFRADVLSRIPLRRIGTVEDVAEAVVYLASPRASLVTGTSLVVDGGWTAQ